MGKISIIFIFILAIAGFSWMVIKPGQPSGSGKIPENSITTTPETSPTATLMDTQILPSVTPTGEKGKTMDEFDKNKKYTAVLTTGTGNITLELYADKTPVTVNNFVTLARKKFYDSTVFHRVIKGFMIQGGDPQGDGTGGPGYKFDDEPFEGEYTRGTVAMANAGPNTNGSQFFIMHQDYPLPKNYVIFGKVINGIEVVDKIAEAPTTAGTDGANSKPVNPVVVKSVVITEK